MVRLITVLITLSDVVDALCQSVIKQKQLHTGSEPCGPESQLSINLDCSRNRHPLWLWGLLLSIKLLLNTKWQRVQACVCGEICR